MSLRRIASASLIGVWISASSAVALQVAASRTALATVVDGRGRAILDIEPDDFVIRETGQSREVLSVRVADYPIALVLDNGSAGAADFTSVREAAARFVGRVGRRPIALALTAPPQLAAALDDDRATVLRRIETARPNDPPASLLNAIVVAAHALADSGSPFSVIVVVSTSPVDAGPVAVIAPVLESGAQVQVIVNGARAVQAGDGTRAPQASGAAAQSTESMMSMLRSMSDQTGGQFTSIYSSASYSAALDRLADRLAPQLLVEYVVPVGSSSGNDVQLGVRIPGARVVGLGVK